jgi:Protein of unknown function (DUF642)
MAYKDQRLNSDHRMKTITLLACVSLICCAVQVASAATIFPIGLVNGDFETPAINADQQIYSYANPAFGFGWQLVPGTDFDLIGTHWQPSSGAQSVDLNGSGPGSLYQGFKFATSGVWAITYDLSASPTGPSSQTVRVDFGLGIGPLTTLGTYTLDATTRTFTNMQWVTFEQDVSVVDNLVYQLQFTSLTPGADGPALDNVRLMQIPEPCVAGIVGLGALGLLLKRRSKWQAR